MLGFGNKDVPEKIVKLGLKKWYSALSESNKVKLGRYIDKADASSVTAFLVSVFALAEEDHNYKFVADLYDTIGEFKLSDIERFDINDAAILGVYNAEDYDRCVELCEYGLALLEKKDVFDHVMAKGNGEIPNEINCRNYLLNVVVGIHFEYDEGDKLLLRFQEMGLITAEDVEYRRNGIKTFRLQRTFDNVFNVKEKEQ
ncbi:MAG: hypothetical protein J5707_03470 [Candidatus Methanomethylophilus sp.]|nr:hypothetical protein [Methanomethylophilus sp.]